MKRERVEAPLETPDQDLLDFAVHATRLVGFIDEAELPLTVGIYGPWGAGKTSFANLIEFELRKLPEWRDAKYINFSAWPYLTPDAIWQALVERIARAICSQDQHSAEASYSMVDTSWANRIRRALLSDALTLRPAKADPAKERYDRLVQRLNIAAGMASRTMNDRVAGLTLGRAASLFLDSASSLVPGTDTIRKLLYGDESGKGLIRTDRVAPALVQTIEDVRSDLQSLFDQAEGAHLIILIDDLDRCLPEVALDVLETVKIFFSESSVRGSSCLFLVAADERLLARGLRARLGEDESVLDRTSEARAYLEKIVQIGIPLPEIDNAHSRKLVATWSPEWATAADLVARALDNNPRRIKQQSTVLSYRFDARGTVSEGNGGGTTNTVRFALNKLVRLNAMGAMNLRQVGTLLRRPNFDQILASHERMDQEPKESDPKSPLAANLRKNPESLRILKRAPLLSGLSQDLLEALLPLADVSVDSHGQPTSKDPALAYIYLTVIAQQGTTTARRLDVSYVRRLLELKQYIPELASELLTERAGGVTRYRHAVRGLDAWLKKKTTDFAAEPSPTARRLAEICEFRLSDSAAFQLLLTRPLLSEIPPEYVRPVLEWVSATPRQGAVNEVTPSSTDELTAAALTAAEHVVPSGGFQSVRLRLDCAREIFERRKFAKVQLLLSRWPILADLARGERGLRRLKDLEAAVLNRDADATVPTSWTELKDDEALIEFLRIPPSFADIRDGELAKIAPTGDALGPVVGSPQGDDAPPLRHYANVTLHVSRSTDASDRSDGRIEFVLALEYGQQRAEQVVALPVQDIKRLSGYLTMGLPATERSEFAAIEPLAVAQRDIMIAAPTISAREAIYDIGTILWSTTLGASREISAIFEVAMAAPDRVRMIIEASDAASAEIPWECLYLPSHRVFIGQTLKLSVVRGVIDPVSLVPVRGGSPLRMLVVASNLAELPLVGLEQEIEILKQTLGVRADAVRIDVLTSPTRQSLLNALQAHAPHIFHYMGHGVVIDGKGAIVLADDRGRPDALLADELGLMLQDYGIMLAVLNGCVTGSVGEVGVGQSVAQTLVRQGVPITIATTRNVVDDAALRFASEFYRSFVSGQPAEASLVEARKAIGLAGFDWSTYVMYGSLRFPIHEIRVPGRTSLQML